MNYNIVGFMLSITILFTGCIEDSKLVFQESNITTIDNTIVEINIPKANGDIQIASKINSVIELHLNNKISLITPEINAFEKLKFLCICNSNLKAYPDVINSHPNKKYLHLCYKHFQ